jgi:tripartite-type tricarboxylate transporter receptor subunit TctC
MITRRNALTLAALPFGLAVSGIARAQSYPAKSIRFVVPFPAGGSTDVAARLIAECLTRAFAQQVYVENKSGANGTIGVEEAAKSGPAAPTCRFTCGRRKPTVIKPGRVRSILSNEPDALPNRTTASSS